MSVTKWGYKEKNYNILSTSIKLSNFTKNFCISYYIVSFPTHEEDWADIIISHICQMRKLNFQNTMCVFESKLNYRFNNVSKSHCT